MPCVRVADAIVMIGNEPVTIAVGGKCVRFEDSDMWGPGVVGTRGEILSAQPGSWSPFWKAHRAWVRQGRRVEDGRCIWRPEIYQHSVNERIGRAYRATGRYVSLCGDAEP